MPVPSFLTFGDGETVDRSADVSSLTGEPKVFEKDGFLLFFYSNDQEPIHVHVRSADGEAIFVITEPIELWESRGMRMYDLRKAQKLAEENKELIWPGVRRGSLAGTGLMIVHDFYSGGSEVRPDETEAVVIVKPNGVRPLAVAPEQFEPMARRRLEVVE